MKVIFLDIDGVVCCSTPGVIEPDKVENLKSIVKQSGAQIVLSSNWRHTKQARMEVKRVLSRHGIGEAIIGRTPQIGTPWSAARPKEITKWIDDHNARVRAGEAPPNLGMVEHFVALDDRPLIQELGGQAMQGHFVQTNFRRGLTKALADAAVRVLNVASASSGAPGPSRSRPGLPTALPHMPSTPPRGREAGVASTSAGATGAGTLARTLPASAPLTAVPRSTLAAGGTFRANTLTGGGSGVGGGRGGGAGAPPMLSGRASANALSPGTTRLSALRARGSTSVRSTRPW
mmetsp:Transcript_8993/g.29545  ORF Transcript_8993/g.29545 Transcript_8993/m.29545 type:complete len:290 (+) Transcript_8993:73-942(+)